MMNICVSTRYSLGSKYVEKIESRLKVCEIILIVVFHRFVVSSLCTLLLENGDNVSLHLAH